MQMHVVVRGRVQGVGFRWFAREAATSLGLAGWVRNRPDGSVETAAEGDATALAQYRAELAKGPQGARVESVDELEPVAGPLERPFTIAR